MNSHTGGCIQAAGTGIYKMIIGYRMQGASAMHRSAYLRKGGH